MNSNSNYFSNKNAFNIYSNADKTAFKNFSKQTPDKKENVNQINTTDYTYNNNDTTIINTNMKFNPESNMSFGTPERVEKNLFQNYESSIQTPIKKSRRRECTPIDSAEDEVESISYVNGNNLPPQNLNFGHNMGTDKGTNFSNNYNLLKMNTGNFNSFNMNKIHCQFQKLSKSKFLDKINNENYSSGNDQFDCPEILEKIKGNYLLNAIESDIDHPNFIPKLFSNIVEDVDLFNKITNLLCYCLFEGFNTRQDIFFKYLVRLIYIYFQAESIYLEIVDQPLDSFNNNLMLLMNYVVRLDPNYSNYQVDMNTEGSNYVFSLNGTSVLNTPNQDILNFILSFRVCFNLSNGNLIRSDSVKLQNLVTVDFIKIKIFN